MIFWFRASSVGHDPITFNSDGIQPFSDTKIMSKASEQQKDERRQRTERRKARFLPYMGKERRSVTVVRDADVFEIGIPPLKGTKDRRDKDRS
jgi:hypothetical protein